MFQILVFSVLQFMCPSGTHPQARPPHSQTGLEPSLWELREEASTLKRHATLRKAQGGNEASKNKTKKNICNLKLR